MLHAAIDIERKLIDELRPTLLDDVGLFAALKWQLKRTWGSAGVISTEKYPNVSFVCDPMYQSAFSESRRKRCKLA